MKKIIQHSIWFALVLIIAACATTPDGYKRIPNDKSKKVNSIVNKNIPDGEEQVASEFITKPVAGETGMIYIERRTKEYSISMVLDASDENVYFVMDLPQEEVVLEEKPTEEKPKEIIVPDEIAKTEEATEEEIEEIAEEPIKELTEETENEEIAKVEEPMDETLTPEDIDAPIPEKRDEARSSKYVLYAQTYFFEKKYTRALEEIKRAIEYSPNSGVAHSLKGSINYKMGDIDKARSSWEQALKLDSSLDNVEKMLKQLDEMEGGSA